MGWNDATEIFDDVAGSVLNSSATNEEKANIIEVLLEKLTDQDWDTLEESIYFNSDWFRKACDKIGIVFNDDVE